MNALWSAPISLAASLAYCSMRAIAMFHQRSTLSTPARAKRWKYAARCDTARTRTQRVYTANHDAVRRSKMTRPAYRKRLKRVLLHIL